MADELLPNSLKPVKILTAEYLRELLHYEPETGQFTWKVSRRGVIKPGTIAGFLVYFKGKPRRFIHIDDKKYAVHRLAWLYVTGNWPQYDIDHINTDSLDNRWDNLRPATKQQNARNRGITVRNTSGFKGVYWNSPARNWKACIGHLGKMIHIGMYNTPEEAHAAYCDRAFELHGEFARTG